MVWDFGLVEYSKILISSGVTILAVANTNEAIILRNAGVTEEIMMLTPVASKNEVELLIKNHVILTIGSLEEIEIAKKVSETINESFEFQIKIDTGFGRYGFIYNDFENILNVFKIADTKKVYGVYTHFSKPIDEKWTQKQFDRFLIVIEKIRLAGYDPGILHVCESTAFFKYRNMFLNAVRIGSAFQGRMLLQGIGLKKIGIFKTNIVEIKEVPAGYNISYSNEYKNKKDTKIAIIPVGYMDGLNRKNLRDSFSFKDNLLSVLMEIKKIFKDSRLKVKINGKEYPIIGRLGMYHAAIDITGADVNINDEVIVNIPPLQASEDIKREYV